MGFFFLGKNSTESVEVSNTLEDTVRVDGSEVTQWNQKGFVNKHLDFFRAIC
jgi:hypothetical protein